MPYPQERIRPYPGYLDGLRYFCAFMLYLYGVSKLAHFQFDMASELAHRSIASLNGYQLTWYYYGYSRPYALILGLTQIGGATLLLFRKTSLLATLIIIPVMANILLINLFIIRNLYGAEVMAALILICMTILLWHERLSLISLFWLDQASEPAPVGHIHWWIRGLIVIVVGTIMISAAFVQHTSQH